MKKIFSLLLLVFMMTACTKKFETIATNRALELIDEGAIVLDVRTISEYEQSHILGAINIPLDVIDTVNFDKNNAIIVYCASGVRSTEAINKLIDMGFTNLYNLDGGLLNWGGQLEE